MKVAIHGKTSHMFVAMLGTSFRQLRHEVVNPEGAVDCNLAIIHGIRDSQLLEQYRDTPTFILESGYLHRVNTRAQYQSGHWQLSKGGLNGIPDFACPGDRFERLELAVQLPVERDGYVLVLGQVPTDTALNGTDHRAWLLYMVAYYEAQGYEVRYRPHPRGGIELPEHPSLPGTLDDAMAGAALVVCYNSTAAFQALLAGIPVVCDPCAPYAELSGDVCPPVAERIAFFNRVAYGQWRCDQTPDAVNFLLNEWLPRCQF